MQVFTHSTISFPDKAAPLLPAALCLMSGALELPIGCRA